MVFAQILAEASNGLVEQAPAITGYVTLFGMFFAFLRWMERRHDAEKAECAAERKAFAEYREGENQRAHKYAVKGAAEFAKRMNLQIPSPGDKQ